MTIGIIGGAGPGAVSFNGYAGKMNLDGSITINGLEFMSKITATTWLTLGRGMAAEDAWAFMELLSMDLLNELRSTRNTTKEEESGS